MRKSLRPVREARSVLEYAGVRKAPVDVFKLALAYADVLEKQLPDSISGMLVPIPEAKRNKKHAIVVNAEHPEVRKRFTVAHELGHLLLHDYQTPHADTGFKIRFRANREYDGTIAEEIEANQFAAELLMPASMILERVHELDLEYADGDDNALKELALEFNVSLRALQIRVSEFI